MPFIERFRTTLTVTATGAGATWSVNSTFVANGLMEAIVITKPAAAALSTAGRLTITGAISGIELLNVTTTGATGSVVSYYPRAAAQNTSNVALGYTSAATPPSIPVRIPLAEPIKFHTTSGSTADGVAVTSIVDFYISR